MEVISQWMQRKLVEFRRSQIRIIARSAQVEAEVALYRRLRRLSPIVNGLESSVEEGRPLKAPSAASVKGPAEVFDIAVYRAVPEEQKPVFNDISVQATD